MIKKIFLTCEEANHTCDKSQYKEATFIEKIKLLLHLIICAACKEYTKNNTKLTKLLNKKPTTLDANTKQKMQTVLDKELAKHNN